LAKTVIARVPRHTCHVEPFAGAAWLFFKKRESKIGVLNDHDDNIVNLDRVIQPHAEFLKQFKTRFVSRRIFELLKRQDDNCLTDIHCTAKWFYLLKTASASTW
jgi:DNA adenine methylase